MVIRHSWQNFYRIRQKQSDLHNVRQKTEASGLMI
jgi:hypothetical protein